MYRIVGILFLAAILSLALGCGKAVEKVTETAVERATGVEVEKTGEGVTVKSQEGGSVTFSSQLPNELKDFPIPAGFQMGEGASMSSSSGTEKLAAVSIKGKSPVSGVVDFYKKALPPKGWTESSAFTTGDAAVLVYRNGPDQSVTITVSKAGEETEIGVLLGGASRR